MPETAAPEPLLDPDCRDGKHGSCVGGPCECRCHVTAAAKAEAAVWRARLVEAERSTQVPAPERTPDETAKPKPTCPRCGSPKWVSVSLDGGWSRRAQCVPCDAYHEPVIGPGYLSPSYNDSEAEHPDYRKERS